MTAPYNSQPVIETLRLLQASSCLRGEVCASLPCACAETLAALRAVPAEVRAATIEECAKIAEGTGACMFTAGEVSAVDALRSDIAAGIRGLAHSRPNSGGAS